MRRHTIRKYGAWAVFLAAGLFCFAPGVLADWSAAKRLTWTSGGSELPDVAVDSNDTIHVVWDDSSPGNEEIYYRKSEDGGTTWTPAKRLTWTSGNSERPAMAMDTNNRIHIVYYDDTPGNREIYYKRSADAGATWSTVKRLTWTSGGSYDPAIAMDSNDTIHVVWYDDTPGNVDIYYKISADGGATWSTVKRLTWTSGGSYDSAIAIDSNDTLHVVWDDDTPNYEIYYRNSADGGATWSVVKRLTWTSGASTYPDRAIDSNDTLHIVWYDNTPGNHEIYYKGSVDGGTTWTAAKRLTWTSGSSFDPVIATDSGTHIHVVWSDYTSGNFEIYYKRSTDAGATWSASKRLTWTSGSSSDPAMAIDSSNTIHVVWNDSTPGNHEIYYKNGK